jgi:uridylate kinase
VLQVQSIVNQNVEVAIVIGGGNIFRGLQGTELGFDRVKGDYMGMLSTIINGLALQSAFESVGQKSRLFTAFSTEPAGERYTRDKAHEAMCNGEVAILTGGTGSPFFSTDTGAALRAAELKAEILLKGTRVDGVYSEDPEKNPDAVKFSSVTFTDVISKKLKIMDLTAFALCRENHIPIYVFDMDTVGNLQKVIAGEHIGTLVCEA